MTQKDALATLIGYREVQDESLGKDALPVSDFTRKPLCECGEGFLDWVEDAFPTLAEDITPRALDEVILVITKEYAHRQRTTPVHRLNHCLKDVFEDLIDAITDRQNALTRVQGISKIRGQAVPEENTQELFIGEDSKD